MLEALGASAEGLSDEEAAQRLDRYGPNAIQSGGGTSRWKILLHQFTSPLIYVLLVAMVVTLVIGEYADAIVIAFVLGLNATIGFFQEYRAENAMQALLKMVSPKATVLRGGGRAELESKKLVPGDVVLLESGDLIPADVRIIEASQLRTDDSILTGESETVEKSPGATEGGKDTPLGDRRNMAYMGTAVASGRARAVVVATGAETQIGLIAGEMRTTERAQTPLQKRMHKFGNRVSVAIVLVCAVAFVVGLSQGVPASDMFLTAVAVAVAAIPEGLPIVMTVALAVCVRRMAKRNAIIRRLPAVETLGSCTVIMSDKTGTLTENRMTVQRVWAGGKRYEVSASGSQVAGEVREIRNEGDKETRGDAVEFDADTMQRPEDPLCLAVLAGVLNNEAELKRRGPDDEPSVHGDPTEVALLVLGARAGVDQQAAKAAWRTDAEIPFESDRRFSARVVSLREGDRSLALVKGAPERVLEMCETMRVGAGEDEPLDRDRVLEAASELAGEGLRVLALAAGLDKDAVHTTREGEPEALTFVGLVGMLDPPREEVIGAIRGCHGAGIRVLMCTGDHAKTASAIAEKIGLDAGPGETATKKTGKPRAVTGAELLDMSDKDLDDSLDEGVVVFARMSPEQKLRIVNRLRERGEVVAVTGDGVNDAPALKIAHIGCAMGITGTDVAKEASEMVLADDNFATIYAAVEEGRTAFSNIRKATDFLLSTSVGVVTAIMGAFILAAFGVYADYLEPEVLPLLLLPAQILWLNVVTNGIQDVALAFEPGEEWQYKLPPRDPDEGLMSPLLVERTILVGLLLAGVALAMFTTEIQRGSDLAYAQGATLTAMVIFKMLHVGACRSDTLSIFQKNLFSNPVLFIGTSLSLAVHLGAMYFPPTQHLLGLQPLRSDTWLWIIIGAPSVLVLVELHKLVRARPGMRNASNHSGRRNGEDD